MIEQVVRSIDDHKRVTLTPSAIRVVGNKDVFVTTFGNYVIISKEAPAEKMVLPTYGTEPSNMLSSPMCDYIVERVRELEKENKALKEMLYGKENTKRE